MSSERGTRSQTPAVEQVLADLIARDTPCAPHVAARLLDALDGDQRTIREVVARLDAHERAGERALPQPLPLVPAISEHFEDSDVDHAERAQLLAAALTLDDRIDPVLAACGVESAAPHRVSHRLRVHAGRFRFIEQRLALWIQATSAPDVHAAMHRTLAGIRSADGDAAAAAWHRARSSLVRDSLSAGVLTRAAQDLSDAGDCELAGRFAAEAAAHSEGAAHDAARLVAGIAAVGAGHMAEAVGWLAGLLPRADETTRLRGLAAFLVAHAHLQGAVPKLDWSRFRPRSATRDGWHAWARVAAFGAALCGERGDRPGAREWMAELRTSASRAAPDSRLRDPVVAFVWLLLGEGEPDDPRGTGAVTGTVLAALRHAVTGDVESGLRVLASGDSVVLAADDPFIAGFEHSDLIRAHQVVIETLLLVWSGDIAGARAGLREAALRLPVAVPFAGLGVVLARRLDLAVLGRLSPFARSLTSALPAATRLERFVDRAIAAHLAGDSRTAASCLRLWHDRGGRQHVFAVPGLDETGPVDIDTGAPTGHRVEPPEMALGRLLRRRAATSADAVWRIDALRIADAARSIASPFERARVEAALGTRALIDGDTAAGRAHLVVARRLFDEAGATAWARAVPTPSSRLTDALGDPGDVEDLATLRRRWEGILTPRELEVAMIAVQGGSNRDIATTLSITVRTVEAHLGRVFAKLGVRSRVDLVLLAHRSARYG